MFIQLKFLFFIVLYSIFNYNSIVKLYCLLLIQNYNKNILFLWSETFEVIELKQLYLLNSMYLSRICRIWVCRIIEYVKHSFSKCLNV